MIKKMMPYIQFLLPTHFISQIVLAFNSIKLSWFKNWQIKHFIKKHGVNFQNAVSQNLNDYADLKSFFIRYIKSSAMGSSKNNEIASPAESTISQFGFVTQETLLQAKNQTFTLSELFANSGCHINDFINGAYMTFHLKRHNYHHFHMPITGKLLESIYIPGRLFEVDSISQQKTGLLYARSERLVTVFETAIGKWQLFSSVLFMLEVSRLFG